MYNNVIQKLKKILCSKIPAQSKHFKITFAKSQNGTDLQNLLLWKNIVNMFITQKYVDIC